MSVDLNDFIYKKRKKGDKVDKLYRCTCNECGADRGYQPKRLANLNCVDCVARWRSEYMKGKHPIAATNASIKARIGKHHSSETKAKISKAHKGKKHSLERRIQNSCRKRNIKIEDFDGFLYDNGDPKRYQYHRDKYSLIVFQMADFTCDLCKGRGGLLHGHHLNNWKQYKEQRYNIDNIVCLCYECHRKFHSQYGFTNNTKEQYLKFKEQIIIDGENNEQQ